MNTARSIIESTVPGRNPDEAPQLRRPAPRREDPLTIQREIALAALVAHAHPDEQEAVRGLLSGKALEAGALRHFASEALNVADMLSPAARAFAEQVVSGEPA